jgi:hypothetical protein
MLKSRLIPLLVLCALATGCNGNSHISTGHGRITVRGNLIELAIDGAPEATIDHAGTLVVDGKPIAVDDHQRELLRRYYASAAATHQHGIDTGKAGAAVAGEALKGVAESAKGDPDSVSRRVEAQTKEITANVMKICDDLAGIKAAQEDLAAALPAFKPYAAIMDDKEINDCRKGAKD